jgi:MtN3 and saliva related transmembrane protein
MGSFRKVTFGVLLWTCFLGSCSALAGCADLIPRDAPSLFAPQLQRSEILGFVAGLGTTFAAVPDLVAMLRRRSSRGINPRMAAIMGLFQILWAYYGLLIGSLPVIAWNVVAVVINFLCVAAYLHFAQRERTEKGKPFEVLKGGQSRRRTKQE